MNDIDDRLTTIAASQPYPLLFATISGAHLYGFPSPDSDFDLRGVHVLPVTEVVGLETGPETLDVSEVREGMELDLVTHDVKKFFGLMLRKNGYVLEQLLSPLIVRSTPEHEELIALAPGCITRHHAHHYFGFAESQWKLFSKEASPRVKPLLYVFRVLLTGIHLMRTGEVEANLVTLNDEFKLPYIPDLIARKLAGPERSVLDDNDTSLFEAEYHRLLAELETAAAASTLPETPSAKPALNDLLVRVRMKKVDHSQCYGEMWAAVDFTGWDNTCPVCGKEDAFSQPGGYEVCHQCHWEDDPDQRNNPDSSNGANPFS